MASPCIDLCDIPQGIFYVRKLIVIFLSYKLKYECFFSIVIFISMKSKYPPFKTVTMILEIIVLLLAAFNIIDGTKMIISLILITCVRTQFDVGQLNKELKNKTNTI